MRYLQISVSTTHDGADLVAALMFDEGSDGIEIRDGADVRELIEKKISWDYVDENLLKTADDKVTVIGFFPLGFSPARLESALGDLGRDSVIPLGSLETVAREINSEDWENEWRKYYAPIEIGNVTVVPAWLKYAGKGTPVYIEPGMAFGTGNHETTALCVSLMQDVGIKDKRVIDMGCGSGILGITAAVLGAKSVLLSDLDPLATEATEHNARLNGVEKVCKITCGDLDLNGEKADIVLANITADVLIRLYDKLGEVIGNGDYAVISGIIHARAAEVENCYARSFDVVRKEIAGEWRQCCSEKNEKTFRKTGRRYRNSHGRRPQTRGVFAPRPPRRRNNRLLGRNRIYRRHQRHNQGQNHRRDPRGVAPSTSEPKHEITLFFGAMKGERNDFVVQKCTELGIKRFVPFLSRFSSVSADGVKVDRLNKIALEAAKQSGRGAVPEVEETAELDAGYRSAKRLRQNRLSVRKRTRGRIRLLKRRSRLGRDNRGKRRRFFARRSGENQKNRGRIVTLGERILRAETACVAVTAVTAFVLGEWRRQ